MYAKIIVHMPLILTITVAKTKSKVFFFSSKGVFQKFGVTQHTA